MAETKRIVNACFKSLGYDVSCNNSGNFQVTNGLSEFGHTRYVARIGSFGQYECLNNVTNYESLLDDLIYYPWFGIMTSDYLRWESLTPIDWQDNPFCKKNYR